MWHMFGPSNNYLWIWMFAAHIIGLLIFIGIIILVIKLINKNTMVQNHSYPSKSLDVLNERYIKGEINEKEYLYMKKILNK
ncbi:SHOCT domain-containing protein [Wukongibacter baidiensis]|uniref:SHOCT domain-containing protein n=1 Tax=Wukongibacter baidiensis TaxID=1723361 RepID=UPI003D7FECBA